MGNRRVRVDRVYETPDAGRDALRILVDRLWPRGLTKEAAGLDEWCREVAPSAELRRWYGHDPARFEEFSRRYLVELEQPARAEALAHLRRLAADHDVILLTGARRPEISQAAVLAAQLG